MMTAKNRTVVFVHDVDAVRSRFMRWLSSQGLHVLEAASAHEAIQCLGTIAVDYVVIGKLSAGMPETLKWVGAIHQAHGGVRIVFAPAQDTLAPVPELPPDDPSWDAGRFLGDSRAIRSLREYMKKVAASPCNVLATGETGTGKELVAEIIHHAGSRRGKALVAVNCAALPDTLVESELFGVERGAYTGAYQSRGGRLAQADGGTLFLDEVGELSLSAQAKLLRVIETRRVDRLGGGRPQAIDVRLVAATNQDLRALMDTGKFRRDLYYRLAVCQLRLPPLREHVEDIELLCRHFLEELRRSARTLVEGIDQALLEVLRTHSWPGNIRELRNLLDAMTVQKTSGILGVEDLPEWFQADTAGMKASPRFEERRKLIAAMEKAGWNKSAAARTLQCSRVTIYRRLARYQIEGGAGDHSERPAFKSRPSENRHATTAG